MGPVQPVRPGKPRHRWSTRSWLTSARWSYSRTQRQPSHKLLQPPKPIHRMNLQKHPEKQLMRKFWVYFREIWGWVLNFCVHCTWLLSLDTHIRCLCRWHRDRNKNTPMEAVHFLFRVFHIFSSARNGRKNIGLQRTNHRKEISSSPWPITEIEKKEKWINTNRMRWPSVQVSLSHRLRRSTNHGYFQIQCEFLAVLFWRFFGNSNS